MSGLLASYGLVVGLTWAAAGLLVVRDCGGGWRRPTATDPEFAEGALKPASQYAWVRTLGIILVGPVVVPCVMLLVLPLIVLRIGLVCGGSIHMRISAKQVRGESNHGG